MNRLTHIDEHGRAAMVDTTEKSATPRRAIASARVLMSAETIAAIRNHQTPKGDPLETARLAGIVAAKRTADLIPLCHPLPKLGGKKKFRFKNKLASLDASTIDLCVVWGALIVVGFAVSNGRVLLFRVTPGTLKAMRRHMQDNARLRLTQTGWNAY